MTDDPKPLPQAEALKQAAEQFLAAVKDGNAADLIDYFADLFSEALAAKP